MRKPIVSDPEIISGTPVFLGTRIPLDHVVGLIRKGVPDSELAEDFPSLNQEDFDYARSCALLVKPSPGSRTIKPIQLRRRTRAA